MSMEDRKKIHGTYAYERMAGRKQPERFCKHDKI
jgi:hypothetical protein